MAHEPAAVAGDLAAIYDPETMALIDAYAEPRSAPGRHGRPAVATVPTLRIAPTGAPNLGRLRRGAATAALTTAILTGVREALEPDADEVYEEVDNGVLGGPEAFVTLFYVPNDAHATRAIVRPWLKSRPAALGAAHGAARDAAAGGLR